MKDKSNPACGFYVDRYHEYDIRHFVGRSAKAVSNVQRVLSEKASDGWMCVYRLNNKAATFIVLCRVRPCPMLRPKRPARSSTK